MIIINKKKILVTAAIILVSLILIAGITIFIFYLTAPWLLPWERARSYEAVKKGVEAYESAPPIREVAPDLDGATLSILCDRDAEVILGSYSLDDNELSRRASNRNDHFEMELEKKLTITPVDDFYTTAREDILSGEYKYNLYVAYAPDAISTLVRDDMLYDFSNSIYITDDAEGYDEKTSSALSLYGKNYLLSSDILDTRLGASVMVYDEAAMKDATVNGKSLGELALSGEFTAENFLTALKTENAAEAEAEAKPFAYASDDIYPVYVALGGSFVNNSDSTITITPAKDVRESLVLTSSIFADENVSEKKNEDVSAFSVATLFDVYNMRSSGAEIGYLPLPKADASKDYRSYIDFGSSLVVAMPSGIASPEKRDYLAYRYMALSESYTAPYIESVLTSGDDNEDEILGIIHGSIVCDYAEFFGYGDISGLIGDLVFDDERFNIEYYNRKELLEKAFDIIKKRIDK